MTGLLRASSSRAQCRRFADTASQIASDAGQHGAKERWNEGVPPWTGRGTDRALTPALSNQ